eukprot:GHVU01011024.1.p2 GENE.GHVU01011024.1~~GHVU01011024.1.p2  ORF type:complete len:175 (+),score=22.89 GHVU01011024.1:656-1180(+)
MATLIKEEANFGHRVLTQCSGDFTAFKKAIDEAVHGLPKQSPTPDHLAPNHGTTAVLASLSKLASQSNEAFIAIDHLMLAVCRHKPMREILSQCSYSQSNIEEAVKKVKGTHKADSSEADNQYESLLKYAQDISGLAATGKLDPVIGREDEIRRIIRILSRRTKNNPVIIGDSG